MGAASRHSYLVVDLQVRHAELDISVGGLQLRQRLRDSASDDAVLRAAAFTSTIT